MASIQSGALDLRFRGHEQTTHPPDVDAFRPSQGLAGYVRERVRQRTRRDPIAVWGSRPLDTDAPLQVFFRHAGYGIPPIGAGHELPDLSSWSVRPTLFGYLATVPRSSPGPVRASRAWIVAACIPLALGGEAMAAPPRDAPAVQRPAKAPPVLPDPPGGEPKAENDASAEAEADVDFVATEDADSALPPRLDDSRTADPFGVPPDAPSVSPFGSDRALVDAAWEGVVGEEVVLTLKGDRELRGRVGAVQHDTFTLIQKGTGMILVLPKSGVVSLRAYVPPDPPDKTGTGLIVGGSILTSVGAPIFISGVSLLAICPSCTYLHLPLLIIGGGALAAGIPLLVRGANQRRAYNRVMREHAVSAGVLRTRYGWTGGVRFRF